MSDQSPKTVAIACQGGGSHTAFTAGVLERFLAAQGSDYEITALTGASGGAICAVLAWYGLRTGGEGGRTDAAIRLLDGFWTDVEATMPADHLVNESVVWTSRLLHNGFPLWQLSPAVNPAAIAGQRWLRRTLQQHLDGPLEELVVDPDGTDEPLPSPTVLVSAVDATDGSFDVFTDRPESLEDDGSGPEDTAGTGQGPRNRFENPVRPLSIDAVLASAAVPPLFDAVELPGPGGPAQYWDGLLSQNPPVRNLLSGPTTAEEKPDEIWVIRINPTTREERLRSLEAINNRRNELAGNLSLEQELHFIDRVNTWLEAGIFSKQAATKYKQVTVRQLELDEERLEPPRRLVTSTKLDRDGAFISDLMELGDTQAEEFLAARDSDEHVVVPSRSSA